MYPMNSSFSLLCFTCKAGRRSSFFVASLITGSFTIISKYFGPGTTTAYTPAL